MFNTCPPECRVTQLPKAPWVEQKMEDPATHAPPEEDGRGVLFQDCSPVFSLWRVDGFCTKGAPRVVWIFQSEGGAVTQEAADSYFQHLETTVATCESDFVTFYDFTDALSNFMPFALQLAKKAARIREVMKPVRTVIVCPNPAVRNVMRIIISIVGGDSPYVIVGTLDQGWETAFAAREDGEKALRDSYEGTSLLTGLDPELAARHAAAMSTAPR